MLHKSARAHTHTHTAGQQASEQSQAPVTSTPSKVLRPPLLQQQLQHQQQLHQAHVQHQHQQFGQQQQLQQGVGLTQQSLLLEGDLGQQGPGTPASGIMRTQFSVSGG